MHNGHEPCFYYVRPLGRLNHQPYNAKLQPGVFKLALDRWLLVLLEICDPAKT